MNPEAKSLFERACASLGLTPEAQTSAWRAIADLQIDPDDPTVIFLAIGQAFSAGTRTMVTRLHSLPDQIEMQALRSVAGLTSTLQDNLVEAARTEMHGALQEHMQALGQHMRVELRRRWIGVVAGLMLGLALIVLTAGAAGYAVGRTDTRGLADDMTRAATSASAADWVQIMQLTPGFDLARDCGPISGNAFEMTDRTAGCRIRIDSDPPPQSWRDQLFANLRRSFERTAPIFTALLGALIGYAIRAHVRKA